VAKRYLRINFDDLFASESWKARSDLQKGNALRQLLENVASGSIPETWKRVAEIRTVGVVGKRKPSQPRETPFKPFYEVWEKTWMEAHNEPYVWDKKTRGAIRTAFAYTGGDARRFEQRVRTLLISMRHDAFFSKNASPAFLISRWNELGGHSGGISSIPIKAGACRKCGTTAWRTLSAGQNAGLCEKCV